MLNIHNFDSAVRHIYIFDIFKCIVLFYIKVVIDTGRFIQHFMVIDVSLVRVLIYCWLKIYNNLSVLKFLIKVLLLKYKFVANIV